MGKQYCGKTDPRSFFHVHLHQLESNVDLLLLKLVYTPDEIRAIWGLEEYCHNLQDQIRRQSITVLQQLAGIFFFPVC